MDIIWSYTRTKRNPVQAASICNRILTIATIEVICIVSGSAINRIVSNIALEYIGIPGTGYRIVAFVSSNGISALACQHFVVRQCGAVGKGIALYHPKFAAFDLKCVALAPDCNDKLLPIIYCRCHGEPNVVWCNPRPKNNLIVARRIPNALDVCGGCPASITLAG